MRKMLIVVLRERTLWHLQKFYNIIKCTTFEINLFTFLLFSPFLNSGKSFNRYNFSIYIDVYTVFATRSPSHDPELLPPLVPIHSGRTCYALLFSNFALKKEKKKMTFFLFKIAVQGVSL
jgi:hypothetical protein